MKINIEQIDEALSNFKVMTAFLDLELKFIHVNHAFAAATNTKPQDLIGKYYFDLYPDAENVALFRQVLDMGEPHTVRSKPIFYTDLAKQVTKYLDWHIQPLIAGKKMIGLTLMLIDVTEQRQSQLIYKLVNTTNLKILEGASLEDILEFICNRIATDFGFALVWIGKKIDDGTIEIQASGGEAHNYLASLHHIGVRWDDSTLGQGPTGESVRSGTQKFLHLDDVHSSPWKHAATEQGLKVTMAVPLRLHGYVYGALTLYSKQEHKFDSPNLLNHISLLSSEICLALEFALEQQQINLLSTAVTSARNAVMITNSKGIIEWINPAFMQLSGYSTAELIGHNPKILKSGKHDGEYYSQLWRTIMSGDVWSADAHERRKDGSIYTVQQTITPIINDGGVITHFVAIHEDVTSKVETHERILHLANHDALTGLPSRKLFVDRLETLYKLTKRNESKLALLFIDLDGFKQVNDTHGHHIGDLLLQEVAVRLMSCVRGSDLVARLGGDEFVTVLYDVDGIEAVSSVAEKILSQMSEPFQLENFEVRIGASLGISLNHAHDQSSESLLKRADAAMYLAKKAGKNSYRFAAIENQ